MGTSRGATGNIILHRLSEISTEIEITAEGSKVTGIAGQEMEKAGGAMLARTSKTNQKLFIAMLT